MSYTTLYMATAPSPIAGSIPLQNIVFQISLQMGSKLPGLPVLFNRTSIENNAHLVSFGNGDDHDFFKGIRNWLFVVRLGVGV